MKPLTVDSQDEETLRDLGSASAQVVHDLKNQLNGLKLYATFLRKRMEKAERPADELETVNKLLAGLERAATDMNVLVRLGRPVEPRRQPDTDLLALMAGAAGGEDIVASPGDYRGEFDPALISEALKGITEGATALMKPGHPTVSARREEPDGGGHAAVFEWAGVPRRDEAGDLFKSFAGSAGMRLALAARVIRAHGGAVAHEGSVLRARLPLDK